MQSCNFASQRLGSALDLGFIRKFPASRGNFRLDEVSTASGDSGGPTFINGLIAGISSFGFGIPGFGDIDEQFSNESFGEFDFDTRISTYASWVDSAVAGNQPSASVPEPSTVLGSLFAFGAFAARSQLKRKQKQKAQPHKPEGVTNKLKA